MNVKFSPRKYIFNSNSKSSIPLSSELSLEDSSLLPPSAAIVSKSSNVTRLLIEEKAKFSIEGLLYGQKSTKSNN